MLSVHREKIADNEENFIAQEHRLLTKKIQISNNKKHNKHEKLQKKKTFLIDAQPCRGEKA